MRLQSGVLAWISCAHKKQAFLNVPFCIQISNDVFAYYDVMMRASKLSNICVKRNQFCFGSMDIFQLTEKQ